MADRIELELGVVEPERSILLLRTGQSLKLTTREAAVLAYLAARPGQTLSREQLQIEVWGYAPDISSRAVDNTIRRLRGKIEADPGQPCHVLTMHGEGYRFVPLASPRTSAGLFGRAAILEQLDAHIRAGAAVLTLTGPGGVGKTRLARALLARGGGRFIDLSAADSAAAVAASLSEGLTTDTGEQAILSALRRQPGALVVLDNCEQVLGAASGWAVRIQQATGRVLVATSRVALGCPGEVVVAVPPLEEDAGIALLAARLSTRQIPRPPDALLGRLVGRLDGIPLALELAAARLGVLGAAELLSRLEDALDLLGEGTLRATVGWSWSLLPEPARVTLSRCTVFRGRFLATDAEALLSGLSASTLDALELLRAHSMIAAEVDADGATRLRILEVIRLHAAEHLPPSDPVWRQHARWAAALPLGRHRPEHRNILAAWRWAVRHDPALAVSLAEAAAAGFRAHGPPDEWVALAEQTGALPLTGAQAVRAMLVVFETHHALRRQPDPALLDAADAAATALGEPPLRARIALTRGRWLRTVGQLGAAAGAYTAGLSHAPPGLMRGHLCFDLASLAADQGRHPAAVARYGEALLEYRALQASDQVTRTELHLAMVRSEDGHLEAARLGAHRALSALIRGGDRGREGVVRCHLVLIALEQRDLVCAEQELARAQACHRAVGARRFEGYGCLLQSMICQDRSKRPEMLQAADQAVSILEEVGDALFVAYARARRGVALALQGQPARAREDLGAARAVMARTGSPWTLMGVDTLLGFVALAEGDEADARARLAAAERSAPSSFVRIAARQLAEALR